MMKKEQKKCFNLVPIIRRLRVQPRPSAPVWSRDVRPGCPGRPPAPLHRGQCPESAASPASQHRSLQRPVCQDCTPVVLKQSDPVYLLCFLSSQ